MRLLSRPGVMPAGATCRPASDSRVSWSAVDITDGEAVTRSLDQLRPSAIYHCAGIADVQGTWAASTRALRVNVIGTHTLLGAVERLRLDIPILVTGSALVYGSSRDALTEDSPLAPSSPYGVSKLAQEMAANLAPGHVILTRSVQSRRPPAVRRPTSTSSFARQIAEAEAGIREPVLAVGNLDARRDITDVRDTVRAYGLLVERGRPHEPYNVCRGEAFRVGDLLESIDSAGEGPDRSQDRSGAAAAERQPRRPRKSTPSSAGHRLGACDRHRRHAAGSPRVLASASGARSSVSTGSPQYSETLRQWVHIAFGAAALLLPFLHWYQAVILAAVAVDVQHPAAPEDRRRSASSAARAAAVRSRRARPLSDLHPPDAADAAWTPGHRRGSMGNPGRGRRCGDAGGTPLWREEMAVESAEERRRQRRPRHRGRSGRRIPLLVVPTSHHPSSLSLVFSQPPRLQPHWSRRRSRRSPSG